MEKKVETIKKKLGRRPIYNGESWHVKILLSEEIHDEVASLADQMGTPMTNIFRDAINIGIDEIKNRRTNVAKRRARRKKAI